MIRAVLFDFDGVILESADIKTEAFRQLFKQDFPDKVEKIVEYHQRNMGVSRYVKFEHIYGKILHLSLSNEKKQKLGERFSEFVFCAVLGVPFVNGAKEFISRFFEKYLMFIASGTPTDELIKLVSLRGIRPYFKGIYGSPPEKGETVKRVLRDFDLRRQEVALVGDADSDRRAAQDNGIYFIARASSSNGDFASASRYIRDLTELEAALAVL